MKLKRLFFQALGFAALSLAAADVGAQQAEIVYEYQNDFVHVALGHHAKITCHSAMPCTVSGHHQIPAAGYRDSDTNIFLRGFLLSGASHEDKIRRNNVDLRKTGYDERTGDFHWDAEFRFDFETHRTLRCTMSSQSSERPPSGSFCRK